MPRVSHALLARAQTGQEPTRPLALVTPPTAHSPVGDFRLSVCSRAHNRCSIKVETGPRVLIATTSTGMVHRQCQITSTNRATSPPHPTTPTPAPVASSSVLMALNPSTHHKASLVDGLLSQHRITSTKCNTHSNSTRRRSASHRRCFSSKWTRRTHRALDLTRTGTRITALTHPHQLFHSTSNTNSALVDPCRHKWVLLLLPLCRRDVWAKANSPDKDIRQHSTRTISVTFLSMEPLLV